MQNEYVPLLPAPYCRNSIRRFSLLSSGHTSRAPGRVTWPRPRPIRGMKSRQEREKKRPYTHVSVRASRPHLRCTHDETNSDRESVSTSHRPRYLWPWPVTLTLNRRRAMVTTRTQAKDHCRRSVLLCSVLNISRRRLDVRNIQGGSKK